MLLDKVRNTIDGHSLLEKGDRVICAVSGGADSVCLLHTMLTLKNEYSISIYVANVNHLIRGEESDKDSDFVRAICKAADIELFYREYDVRKIAEERKIGEEECGRILRYEFFDELSRRLGGAKIATAHNLNDNAETVLFRLARGSAMQGLCGIMHKRDNIIRPLLDVSREEIENYLYANSLSWREDSTNKIPVYARNKIRLNVMPLLNEISSKAEEKIVTAARYIHQDNEFINECAKIVEKECLKDKELLLKPFEDSPLSLKRRIAASALEKWGAKEITADKIESFMLFVLKDNGKKLDINKDIYAQKSYGKVLCCKYSTAGQLDEMLDIGKDVCADGWRLTVIREDNPIKITGNNAAVFDAEKLSLPLTVSYRSDGDKILLKGLGGTKKISDIFSDEKIESNLRNYIPIVKKDSDIIYVGGLRQSSLYATDKTTKRYIVIKYERRD